MIEIDTLQFSKALMKSSDRMAMAYLSANVMDTKMGRGPSSISMSINRLQSRWRPLNEDYLARKIRKGLDPRKWVRTGTFLKGVEGTITKVGSKGGVKFSYNHGKYYALLDLQGLIGARTRGGGRRPNARGKKDAAYANEFRRRLVGFQDADKPVAARAAAKALQTLLKNQGLSVKGVAG